MSTNSTPPRRNFGTDSILFHKLTVTYNVLHKRIEKFPKKDKYTIGIKIETTYMELVEYLLLAEIKSQKSKMLLLERSDVTLKLLKLLVRVAYISKILPDTGYIEVSEHLIEIGRILGGWIKKTKGVPVGTPS